VEKDFDGTVPIGFSILLLRIAYFIEEFIHSPMKFSYQ
jgi:hypothetical protein